MKIEWDLFVPFGGASLRVAMLAVMIGVRTQAATVSATVGVGSYPIALAVNAVTNKVYVANQNDNTVTVIDGASNTTTTIPTGTQPSAVGVNEVTNRIYVVNSGSNNVTVIDGATNGTTTVAVGAQPGAVAINSNLNKIYIANAGSPGVTVIDGTTNATTNLASVAASSAIAVNPVTNKIYAATSNTVTVIDAASYGTTTVAVGALADSIGVNPVTNKIYVANYDTSLGFFLTVIDGATNTTTSLPGSLPPSSVAVDANTNKVYVSGQKVVDLIDGATNAVKPLGVLPLAGGPITVNPMTNKIYVADANVGDVFEIDGATESVTFVSAGKLPYALAVNSATNKIYVGNTGSNTVTVIDGAPGSPGPLQFVPVTPCRIADTRNANGAFGGPELGGGSTRNFDIPNSACGIPSTALAYSLNVTVVPNGGLGYLAIWPQGQTQPVVSTLNSDGRVKANAAIVPAGTGGGVAVYVSDSTHVILDINGYFVFGSSTALNFYPLPPCRIADTRTANGALGGPFLSAGVARSFPMLSSSCNIPSTAQAYSLNFTAIPHTWLGYLSTWPAGQAQPVVSTLNSSGAVTANAAIVPAGTGGAINTYASNDSDLVIDINGYFAPQGQYGLSLYTVTPCRVLDTRTSSGAFVGVLQTNVFDSSCPVSLSAQAYVLNTTVVPPGGLGFLTLWATGVTQPYVSTLNSDGSVASNMAIVPTLNGWVSSYASNQTQMILDISGFFAP